MAIKKNCPLFEDSGFTKEPVARLIIALSVASLLRLGITCVMICVSYYEGSPRDQSGIFWMAPDTSQVANGLIFRDPGGYLTIAVNGYKRGDLHSAFYPLWPFLIQPLVGLPMGMVPWGMWLLSNILTIVGSCLLFFFVSKKWGRNCAWIALFLQNAFPASHFLYLPFSEPLFFFLFCGLLWALERRLLLIAAVTCFLLPLTRPVGVLLLPGVAVWSWTQRRSVAVSLAFPILILTGFVAYLGCMYYFTGNAFEGFVAQKLHVNQPSLGYLLDPWPVMRRFFTVSSIFGPTEGLLDRLCFLMVLVGMVVLWKFNRIWWFMVMPMAILPAITNLFLSYRRFMIVLVPLTIAVAVHGCGSERKKKAILVLCAIGLVLQIIQLWEHVNGRWAG